MPDELDTRIRALEAERLRPVPPPPIRLPPRHADLPAAALEAARIADTEERYRAAVAAHARTRNRRRTASPEPPGPSDPTETTRKDR